MVRRKLQTETGSYHRTDSERGSDRAGGQGSVKVHKGSFRPSEARAGIQRYGEISDALDSSAGIWRLGIVGVAKPPGKRGCHTRNRGRGLLARLRPLRRAGRPRSQGKKCSWQPRAHPVIRAKSLSQVSRSSLASAAAWIPAHASLGRNDELSGFLQAKH